MPGFPGFPERLLTYNLPNMSAPAPCLPTVNNPASPLFATLALLIGGCSLLGSAPRANLEVPRMSPQAEEYFHLVNRLKQEDFNLDFGDLRLAWSHTHMYLVAPDIEKRALAEVYRAEAKGDYEGCLKKVGEVLAFNYTSLVAHSWAQQCARAQGQQVTADFHQSMLDNLLFAVLATGDGTTPKTAWKVTGAAELSGLLLLLTMQLEDIQVDEKNQHLARVQAWDYLEQQQRIFWADYSIPLERYQRAGMLGKDDPEASTDSPEPQSQPQ